MFKQNKKFFLLYKYASILNLTVFILLYTALMMMMMIMVFVCFFDLILYVPSTIFQLNRTGSSWVEPVLSYDKCVLLKDHNAVTPLRLEPTVPRSQVK